ncbi:MAG TPA: 50S ribosomal protein L30 [Candidatus Limnocylindria bacterium]|jgi:large subunit ribosomal protein L30|nr:50S ribosomal protein L30 [Candidatus Limnocylindria bacterium]
MSRLEIRQHKSSIGEKQSAKGTLQALGLKRTGQRVSHEDTPALRGMLRKVAHLVEVGEGKSAR